MNNEFWNIVQAASNLAASNVSGPVDILSWALRKAGAPVPENALLSSKWMEEQGLMKPVRPGVGQMVGESVGLISPVVLAAKASQVAKAAIKAGENLAAPATLNKQRGIFMGDLSKTWDKAAADKARQMEKAGIDPKKIWEETGTFKGVDGKWRQEIDDSASMFRGTAPTDRATVGQAIHHQKLADAYQESSDMLVQRVPGTGGSFSGEMGYRPSSPTVNVGLDNGTQSHSVALHELQHAVQGREGFARGGSPSQFGALTPADRGALVDKVDGELAKLAQKYGDGTFIFSGFERGKPQTMADPEIKALLAKKAEILASRDPMEQYRRLAGEAEARAVQSRMNLSPLERRALFPLDSYDVPVDQLIVRGGSGPQASILERNGVGLLDEAPPMPALLTDGARRMETARINAMKPVSEGGLGLGPTNTAQERAKALGFDMDGFHGTPSEVKAFDPAMVAKHDYGAIGQGVYVDPSKDASYANAIGTILGDPAGFNVMPLKVRSGNVFDADALPAITSAERSKAVTSNLRNQGVDSVLSSVGGVPNEMVVFDPKNIRSRFAAFDPMRRNESDLLGGADPYLLALLGLGAGGLTYAGSK